jgi:hypothetical protein
MTLKEYFEKLIATHGEDATVADLPYGSMHCLDASLKLKSETRMITITPRLKLTREQLAVKIADAFSEPCGKVNASILNEYRERFLSPPTVPSGGEAPKAAPATEGGAVDTVGANPESFTKALESVINKFSMENGSDTPDFILAEYMGECLRSFDRAVHCRSRWYGWHDAIGGRRESTCMFRWWRTCEQ